MGQRFEINAGGGAKLPILGGLAAAPVIAVYLRFIQRESWTVVLIVLGVVLVLVIGAAVWGSRMAGKAIELTDDGIVFPRVLSNEPETILWTGIEGYESGASLSVPITHWFEIIHYGGRRRRISDGEVLDYEGLDRAVRAAIDARKKAD